jgi:hypothetical protein
MTDPWQYDTCGRHFTSTENRIGLARKFRDGHPYEYVSYRDICIDYNLCDKKVAEKRRRNHAVGSPRI